MPIPFCTTREISGLARLRATEQKRENEREQAQAAARDAEEAYKEYARQHEKMQYEPPLPTLDDDAVSELKSLYREARSLCHPDKVPDDRKEAAHQVFIELQEAYKSNDLERLREIHLNLKAGDLPGTRASALSEVEALRGAIAEIEYAIARLVAGLHALNETDGVRLMRAAGATETEWYHFFEKQRESLDLELTKIVLNLAEQSGE